MIFEAVQRAADMVAVMVDGVERFEIHDVHHDEGQLSSPDLARFLVAVMNTEGVDAKCGECENKYDCFGECPNYERPD